MRRMPGQRGVIVGCSAVTEGDLGLGVFCPRTRGAFAVRALLLGGVVAGFVCDCWARAFALRSPFAVLGFALASARRYRASSVAPVRGGTYFSLPPQRKVGKRKRLTPPALVLIHGPPTSPHFTRQHIYLRALPTPSLYASPASRFRVVTRRATQSAAAQVANCVSAFAPYTHHSGLCSKIGVSGKSTKLCGATTYTQFATWAAYAIRCRWSLYGCMRWVVRFFDALATGK